MKAKCEAAAVERYIRICESDASTKNAFNQRFIVFVQVL